MEPATAVLGALLVGVIAYLVSDRMRGGKQLDPHSRELYEMEWQDKLEALDRMKERVRKRMAPALPAGVEVNQETTPHPTAAIAGDGLLTPESDRERARRRAREQGFIR